MNDDRIYTAYAAESEHYEPEPPVDALKLVPNAPVPPHPRDLDHDVTPEDEGEFLKCDLCGHVYMPWPGRERCNNCGAQVRKS